MNNDIINIFERKKLLARAMENPSIYRNSKTKEIYYDFSDLVAEINEAKTEGKDSASTTLLLPNAEIPTYRDFGFLIDSSKANIIHICEHDSCSKGTVKSRDFSASNERLDSLEELSQKIYKEGTKHHSMNEVNVCMNENAYVGIFASNNKRSIAMAIMLQKVNEMKFGIKYPLYIYERENGKINKENFNIEQKIGIIREMIQGLKMNTTRIFYQLGDQEKTFDIIEELEKDLKSIKNIEKGNKNMEQPLRSYLSQCYPEIKINPNYINYSQFQRISDEKSQTEKRKNPLVSGNNVIGELEETEVYDFETATSKTTRLETIESEKGIYTINSEIQRNGEQYSVTSTMDILNEISKSREKAIYTRDMNGNETYTYMENGAKGQVIKKTERGTTIDIYKDGQPYTTYEYDENGKALVPMGTLEQLPEDYIESCFRMPLPEYEEIQYQAPEQEMVSTQKLGKETLDMQQDTQTIDDVEKQMEEQEFEINQSGEIIRKGRTGDRFDLSGTTSDYATQTLNEFTQNLDNGNLDEDKKKKEDEFKVEKGDDDYIR